MSCYSVPNASFVLSVPCVLFLAFHVSFVSIVPCVSCHSVPCVFCFEHSMCLVSSVPCLLF